MYQLRIRLKGVWAFALLMVLVMGVSGVYGQSSDIIFFDESSSDRYYDSSFGFSEGGSSLQLRNETKAPVDTQYVFRGDHSLKLNWKSVSGGSWGMAVASPGWPGHDITTQDTLSFWVFSNESLRSTHLPAVQVEDLDNEKSESVSLSQYVDTLRMEEWQLVRIPVAAIERNQGASDLSRIKTVWWVQDQADGVRHILYVDNVRMFSGARFFPDKPEPVSNLSVQTYERHITLSWENSPSRDVESYRIYRVHKADGSPELIGTSGGRPPYFVDFRGEVGKGADYWVRAVDTYNNESDPAGPVTGFTESMTDSDFMDMVQRAVFRYFWDYGHPVSGLARERYGSGEIVTIGGSGFGVMAILVGIHRDFITRKEGRKRVLKIVNFLKQADRFHGAWPHWMDGSSGEVIPFSEKDNGGDLVETAFMMQGLLTARSFFDRDVETEIKIRSRITELWESVEWNWYRKSENSNVLYWHWSPDHQWEINLPIRGWNETMIVYILGISSPTHGVPGTLYREGWAGGNYVNGESYYGHKLWVGSGKGGPLFFTHYSFQGFDPRDIRDDYTNYFNHNRNQTLVNRAYCMDNPLNHRGYGPKTWGLTASDEPGGYGVHAPNASQDNGTISPTAALSSMPYTPDHSMKALKHMYRTYGKNLWGIFGFRDAFNLTSDWFADSYLAIDQGPIINMIENHRSELLWHHFMENQAIISGLRKAGFEGERLTSVEQPADAEEESVGGLKLMGNYPNPFNGSTQIRYELYQPADVTINLYSISGQKLLTLFKDKRQSKGVKSVRFSADQLNTGLYLYEISTDRYRKTGKLLLVK